MNELAFAPALEQARLVRERAVDPVELAELYLERIDRIDPQLRSYVTVDADGALAQARSPRPGPFAGVPISLKDLHETAGLRTTYSVRSLARNVPTFDTAAIRRIREAGFTVLGKTNTCELGTLPVTESLLNGDCRNPWDTSRTPGGSSGGAAAALAAGLCAVAHASDGGGSIRIPAACCGLFGLKPSRGRVSPAPWGAGTLALSAQGPIARTVRDAAALLDVMSGPEPGDTFSLPCADGELLAAAERPPGRLRFAVVTEPPLETEVDATCVRAARELGELLGELGHERVELAPPWRGDDVREPFLAVWRMGPALAGVAPDELEPINRALAELALAAPAVELGRAVVRLQAYARKVVSAWNDVDVLVTPQLALPPVPIGWHFEAEEPLEQLERAWRFTPFTALVNVTGQPAVSIPFGAGEHGLPLGVQVIGPPAGDALLVSLAAQLEEARPWAGRVPPLAQVG